MKVARPQLVFWHGQALGLILCVLAEQLLDIREALQNEALCVCHACALAGWSMGQFG